jgi:hypothetical protein
MDADEEGHKQSGIETEAPADTFALVANEQRFEMLTALWDAQQDGDLPLSFSDFHDRVAMRDSGQFNYHLGQLTPRFVRQRDGGYELTFAGQQIIGATVSGTYTDPDVAIESVAVGECPECGSTLEGRYDAGRAIIECVDCETVITDYLSAPPVLAAHHEPEELPAVFARLLRTQVNMMIHGFCSVCGGPIENTPVAFTDDDPGFATGDAEALRNSIVQRCLACGNTSYGVVGIAVLHHPAVVSFLYDHGVNVHSTPLWEYDWLLEDHATVRSESPPRLEVTIGAADDSITVTIDDACAVVAVGTETDG